MSDDMNEVWASLGKGHPDRGGVPGPGHWTPRQGDGAIAGCYLLDDVDAQASAEERFRIANTPLKSSFAPQPTSTN